MARTQLQFTEEQLAALKALSQARGTSVSAIIRAAVDDYLACARRDDWQQALEETAGAIPQWEDGVQYQRRMREAWGRRSEERMRGR